MPILFVAIPALIAWYGRLIFAERFAFRAPESKFVFASAIIGLSAWIPAHEINLLQQRIIGVPEMLEQNAKLLMDTFQHMPLERSCCDRNRPRDLRRAAFFRDICLMDCCGEKRVWSAISRFRGHLSACSLFPYSRFLVTAALAFCSPILLALALDHPRHDCPLSAQHDWSVERRATPMVTKLHLIPRRIQINRMPRICRRRQSRSAFLSLSLGIVLTRFAAPAVALAISPVAARSRSA